jgi:hypothetical protein
MPKLKNNVDDTTIMTVGMAAIKLNIITMRELILDPIFLLIGLVQTVIIFLTTNTAIMRNNIRSTSINDNVVDGPYPVIQKVLWKICM